MKKILLMTVLVFLGFLETSWAQPMMPQMGFKTGVLKGTLFTQDAKGTKSPVKEHPVAIMVFQNGQRVLMLDKTTDAQGRFEFVNIFRDPSFSYTLGTMQEEKLYLMTDIQLAENEEKRSVEFRIGDGSSHLVPESVVRNLEQQQQGQSSGTADQAMPPKASSGVAVKTAGHEALKGSKRLALGLSAVVVAYAFYFALRRRSA